MPLRPFAYLRAALLALLLLCILPGANALATIAPGSSVPAGATGVKTPDTSEITNLFAQGWRGGKVNDRARFQSSLIPVANTEWNEIVNYDCVYPKDATRATPGSPVPEDALVKLNQVFKEAEGKSGADLSTFLRDTKKASGNGAFADFITVTDDKSMIYDKLAGSGCELNKTVTPDEPGLTELFTSPVGFMQKMAVNLGTMPARTAYNLTAPHALRYAFFTPHAERGETIFSIIGADDKQTSRMGFSKAAIENPETVDSNSWIRVALWIRWFLAGFFVLITVTIGFMYMMSKSGRRQSDLLRTLPRLLLATFLMVVIGPLMGWIISISNLVTRSLFGISTATTAACKGNGGGVGSGGATDLAAGDCGLLSQINGQIERFLNGESATAAAVGSLPGGDGAILDSLDKILLGSAILWVGAIFFVMLLIISVARQLILIVLVAISPAACFAITFQKTQKWALRWLQAFAVVCLAPAMMSVALYFGLTLAWATISIPILWFMMMIVTFVAVWKIPLMIKGWFSGESQRAASTQAINLTGNVAGAVGGPKGEAVAAGLHGVGAGAGMADNAMSSAGARTAAPDFVSSGRRRQTPPRLEAAEKARGGKGRLKGLQERTGLHTSNPHTGQAGDIDRRTDAEQAAAERAGQGASAPQPQYSAIGAIPSSSSGDGLRITEMELSFADWQREKDSQEEYEKSALARGQARPPAEWHYTAESRGGTTMYLKKRNPNYKSEEEEYNREQGLTPAASPGRGSGGGRTVRMNAAAAQQGADGAARPAPGPATAAPSTAAPSTAAPATTAPAPAAPATPAPGGTQQTGKVTQVSNVAPGPLKGGSAGSGGTLKGGG